VEVELVEHAGLDHLPQQRATARDRHVLPLRRPA
jgi:hypothetical protein